MLVVPGDVRRGGYAHGCQVRVQSNGQTTFNSILEFPHPGAHRPTSRENDLVFVL